MLRNAVYYRARFELPNEQDARAMEALLASFSFVHVLDRRGVGIDFIGDLTRKQIEGIEDALEAYGGEAAELDLGTAPFRGGEKDVETGITDAVIEKLAENAHDRWIEWFKLGQEAEPEGLDKLTQTDYEEWPEDIAADLIGRWADKDYEILAEAVQDLTPERLPHINGAILDQWIEWWEYQRDNSDEPGRVEGWEEQAETSYSNLSEEDKDKDRPMAEKVIEAAGVKPKESTAAEDEKGKKKGTDLPAPKAIEDPKPIWKFDSESDAEDFATFVEQETELDADSAGVTVAVWPKPSKDEEKALNDQAESLGGGLIDLKKAKKEAESGEGQTLTPETMRMAFRLLKGQDPYPPTGKRAIAALRAVQDGSRACRAFLASILRTADATDDWLAEVEEEYGADWREEYGLESGDEEALPVEETPEVSEDGEFEDDSGQGIGRALTPEEEEAEQKRLEQQKYKSQEDFMTEYGKTEGTIRYMGQMHRLMNLDYVDRFGNVTNRNVEPYEIREPYFWAYSHGPGTTPGKGIRMFHMGRIIAVAPARGRFIPRWDIKLCPDEAGGVCPV